MCIGALQYNDVNATAKEWIEWMPHRKRSETKQQPNMLPGQGVPGCCLVSYRFLCDMYTEHVGANAIRRE